MKKEVTSEFYKNGYTIGTYKNHGFAGPKDPTTIISTYMGPNVMIWYYKLTVYKSTVMDSNAQSYNMDFG